MECREILIEELRNAVKDLCTHEYQYSDGFLLRWLKFQHMDVLKAITAYKANLDWRTETKMDSILEEDFSDMEKFIPIDCETIDKHGRVVVKIFLQDFNMKPMKLDESKERVIRYSLYLSEKIEKAIQAQSEKTCGVVNQCVNLVDCKGLSDVVKSIGWTKLPLALRLLQEILGQLNPNFPGTAQINCIMNSSRWFTKIFQVLKPIMHKETLASTQIHGANSKFNWKTDLVNPDGDAIIANSS